MRLDVEFYTNGQRFEVGLAEYQRVSVHEAEEYYTGPYTATPKVYEQTLSTKDKLMTDNVSIKSVPVYETSNLAGGKTFYIARED